MIQLCRHILPGGRLCDQASVRGTLFCRHHSTVKAAIAREQAAPDPEVKHTPIAFVYPEDRAAIQLNLFLVIQALNDRRIDNRTANTMNRLLHSCEQNLRAGALAEATRETTAQQVVTLPNGDEVGMPREAMEAIDDPAEMHGTGCACQECAGKADQLPKERHHAACRCGACEPAVGTTGEAAREATMLALHNVPPEPFDWTDSPAWLEAEPQGSAYQDMLIEQCREKRAREQQARDEAVKEALAAEYELRMDGEVQWKKGMKEALLEDFKQALAEGRPYEPRSLAAASA